MSIAPKTTIPEAHVLKAKLKIGEAHNLIGEAFAMLVPAPQPLEQFVIVTHGDGAESFIVNSREEMEREFLALLTDDKDTETREQWLRDLRDPESWKMPYPHKAPFRAFFDLEDGGVEVIRLHRFTDEEQP